MDILLKIWKILRLPSGLQLLLMRRFNDQFLIGVTGIIFDKEKRILVFKHTYRNVYKWSLPGGYLKAKEHPKEGLEREILEESGLVISADERLKLRTDRTSARIDITYIGSYIGGEFKPSSEVEEAHFYAFENLPKLSQDQLYLIDKALGRRNSKLKA
jgi:ADP-ribose pyrophosphatase YjhB (NUDIX family)